MASCNQDIKIREDVGLEQLPRAAIRRDVSPGPGEPENSLDVNTEGISNLVEAWAIFLAYYLSNSTFPEATQLEYALIGGMSISQALLISPIVSISTRHLGTRVTMLIGTALVFVSLLTASFATKIWHLFLSQGLCFGYGMGLLYITSANALPAWFSTRRSLAVGLATSGAGMGGLVYNLVAGRAIQTVGPQWTYRILAFCALAVNLLCSILIKDRNKTVKPQQIAFNYREYARIEILLVIIWGFLTELGYVVLLYSLPNYANSIGLSHSQGSVVGAVLNLGLAVGRPIIGYYSDTFGRINIATVMTAFCGILCLALWVPAKTYGLLLTFALLSGTCCGIFWGTVVAVTAEVVGLQRLPSAFGMICLPLVLPTTFAEPIALGIVSKSGYLTTQIIVGSFFLLAATSTWILRSWKINEIEKKAQMERRDAGIISRASIVRHDFWLTPRKLFVTKRV